MEPHHYFVVERTFAVTSTTTTVSEKHRPGWCLQHMRLIEPRKGRRWPHQMNVCVCVCVQTFEVSPLALLQSWLRPDLNGVFNSQCLNLKHED